jgi:hypothetical protein
MSWQIEIPIIVRSLINDLSDNPTYSDERIQQLIVVAAQYVVREISLSANYTINIITPDITPDPTLTDNKDQDFIGFVALKSACILDQSSLRTRATMDGVRAALGPASISVAGSSMYTTILNQGPCSAYDKLRIEHQLGNSSLLRAILSPFVGNNFDPTNLNYPGDNRRDIYS